MSDTKHGFRRVAILGLGVMGGSLARRLDRGVAEVVVGWSPDEEERAAAVASGAISEAPERWQSAVRGADLVVLATPMAVLCDLVEQVAGILGPHSVLTDVGSLKYPVAEVAERSRLASRWVGSHPMAGREESGFAASSRDLFTDATIWICSHPEARGPRERVSAFWRAIGARPVIIDAQAHDTLVALASHLPQLTATALATTLEASGISASDLGPGGRDMTRLAASNPSMWRDILAHAPPVLSGALRILADSLTDLADKVEEGRLPEIEATMRRSRAWRRGT